MSFKLFRSVLPFWVITFPFHFPRFHSCSGLGVASPSSLLFFSEVLVGFCRVTIFYLCRQDFSSFDVVLIAVLGLLVTPRSSCVLFPRTLLLFLQCFIIDADAVSGAPLFLELPSFRVWHPLRFSYASSPSPQLPPPNPTALHQPPNPNTPPPPSPALNLSPPPHCPCSYVHHHLL